LVDQRLKNPQIPQIYTDFSCSLSRRLAAPELTRSESVNIGEICGVFLIAARQ